MAAKKHEQSEPKAMQTGAIARNKKARFRYHILDTFEAGIVLQGSEIKSIRNREVALDQSYARINAGELFLIGLNIAPYPQAGYAQHVPTRPRKLLVHRREIGHLVRRLSVAGHTLVPLSIYLKRGLAKVEIGVARGKQVHDKREDIKQRDAQREIGRALSRNRRR